MARAEARPAGSGRHVALAIALWLDRRSQIRVEDGHSRYTQIRFLMINSLLAQPYVHSARAIQHTLHTFRPVSTQCGFGAVSAEWPTHSQRRPSSIMACLLLEQPSHPIRVDEAYLNDLADLLVADDGEQTEGLRHTHPDVQRFPSATVVGRAKGSTMRQLAPAPRLAPSVLPKPRASGRTAQAPAPAPPPLREQDRLLPMANVARLMAMELPKDAKIARDAKVLMQEMVSEFICFITSEANDVSIAMGRKALTPDDILAAFENLGESCLCLLPFPCHESDSLDSTHTW